MQGNQDDIQQVDQSRKDNKKGKTDPVESHMPPKGTPEDPQTGPADTLQKDDNKGINQSEDETMTAEQDTGKGPVSDKSSLNQEVRVDDSQQAEDHNLSRTVSITEGGDSEKHEFGGRELCSENDPNLHKKDSLFATDKGVVVPFSNIPEIDEIEETFELAPSKLPSNHKGDIPSPVPLVSSPDTQATAETKGSLKRCVPASSPENLEADMAGKRGRVNLDTSY